MKFPKDAPTSHVLRALGRLGFQIVREAEHIQLQRHNPDGTVTRLTLPNHRTLKSSTLRGACTRAQVSREQFMRAYEETQ